MVKVLPDRVSATGETEVPPPDEPDPTNIVQVLVAVHANRFEPGVASVLKNSSPLVHADGSTVPLLAGFVEVAPLKSTLLL
jgi:hypothetical protein